MKLRNKKTGEIGHFTSTNWNETALIIMDDNGVQLAKYSSLAELNADWEDYKEPKEYWYIDINGEIMFDNVEDDTVKVMREIGNYFETKEEAEQAVEKLKAYKKLKDNGMKKYSFRREKRGIDLDFYTLTVLVPKDKDSLDLLFGGEE